MLLPLIIFSLFLISTAVPIAGEDLQTLPKRASLQQVIAFLNKLNKMMKDTQPSYRLHKRGDQNCCNEKEGKTGVDYKNAGLAYMVAKRLRSKLYGLVRWL